jgi:hypothetical protein
MHRVFFCGNTGHDRDLANLCGLRMIRVLGHARGSLPPGLASSLSRITEPQRHESHTGRQCAPC